MNRLLRNYNKEAYIMSFVKNCFTVIGVSFLCWLFAPLVCPGNTYERKNDISRRQAQRTAGRKTLECGIGRIGGKRGGASHGFSEN